MMEMVCTCTLHVPALNMWLLSTCDVASAAEELSFEFILISINFNMNGLMWLVATLLDSKVLECSRSSFLIPTCFTNFFFFLISLFIFGCVGSSLLHAGFF